MPYANWSTHGSHARQRQFIKWIKKAKQPTEKIGKLVIVYRTGMSWAIENRFLSFRYRYWITSTSELTCGAEQPLVKSSEAAAARPSFMVVHWPFNWRMWTKDERKEKETKRFQDLTELEWPVKNYEWIHKICFCQYTGAMGSLGTVEESFCNHIYPPPPHSLDVNDSHCFRTYHKLCTIDYRYISSNSLMLFSVTLFHKSGIFFFHQAYAI